ncbi:MAG: hypothetical protein K6B14_05865 [Lachnospiraceae bacterium]|nr:hypothetical protein [Lachnospiraceae bacterium]
MCDYNEEDDGFWFWYDYFTIWEDDRPIPAQKKKNETSIVDSVAFLLFLPVILPIAACVFAGIMALYLLKPIVKLLAKVIFAIIKVALKLLRKIIIYLAKGIARIIKEAWKEHQLRASLAGLMKSNT